MTAVPGRAASGSVADDVGSNAAQKLVQQLLPLAAFGIACEISKAYWDFPVEVREPRYALWHAPMAWTNRGISPALR